MPDVIGWLMTGVFALLCIYILSLLFGFEDSDAN